ncbi:class I SAM-dependent methyltransferase [Natronococcus occultus]|uniref:Methylase involved in ubiquinone/menaquinone biosynthesis n=1 Tax=Natronococcus occultus SP4 TaxID=694430 RepID=L0JZ24_9EURY|nr:class I SAM-dependent methyltransferase [Natronococcus occultus]AGB37560.1 methylase involved in ubiquinone/menaquinone biosynthesis [Natronococcus occultus SP4]
MIGPRYYFGIYHWRRRLRSIATAAVVIVAAAVAGRRTRSRSRRLVAAAVGVVAAVRIGRTLRRLGSPPPWALERAKYDALASRLPFDRAQRVLDVGCGTGRSLVGLAPHVPDGVAVLGLDVFDDRVIHGNGPQLARRNAARAGLDAEPVAADAATLPLETDSVDVATACRVLHDLPAEDAAAALAELRRVCGPEGTVGVLELPLVPDDVEDDPDPESYWSDRIVEAGFEIEALERLELAGRAEPYIVVVARPNTDR